MRFLVVPNWFRHTEAANDNTRISSAPVESPPSNLSAITVCLRTVHHLFQLPDCLVVVVLVSIPTELGNLDSFTYLDMSRDSFTVITPTELGNLNSLVYLFIEENSLEGTMPLQLWNIPDLCEL